MSQGWEIRALTLSWGRMTPAVASAPERIAAVRSVRRVLRMAGDSTSVREATFVLVDEEGLDAFAGEISRRDGDLSGARSTMSS